LGYFLILSCPLRGGIVANKIVDFFRQQRHHFLFDLRRLDDDTR